MRTIGISVGIWLTVLLASCGNKKDNFDASGTFEATEVLVSSEASGRILQLDVDEGRRLEAGQVVGYVDSVQLYLKKMQLLTSRKATESKRADIAKQIAATKQQIATEQREKVRYQNLLEQKAANAKQLDDIDDQIALLEKQLTAQMSTLESCRNAV